MNILITGAAGGIGSVLSILLTEKGYNVIGIDNLNNGYKANLIEKGRMVCELYEDDVRDTEFVKSILSKNKIDYIIHLAAITSLPQCEVNPSNCFDVNVSGTASILSAARHFGCKIIFASTSAIYENTSIEKSPFHEDVDIQPRLMYPLSKKLAEDVIASYKTNYDMDITTLRFFNVFGPRQDIHRKSPPLLNYIVKSVKSNSDMTFFSHGNQVRDYVHVSDVLSLIEKCLIDPKSIGETFNVCTSTLTSVRDIVSYAEEAFAKQLKYSFNDSKEYWKDYQELYTGKNIIDSSVIEKEVNKYALGSYEKAKNILDWQPNTDIKDLMIKTMIENYERYM